MRHESVHERRFMYPDDKRNVLHLFLSDVLHGPNVLHTNYWMCDESVPERRYVHSD